MLLRWKVNVLQALREKGYYPHRMRVEKLFGEATIQKMRHQRLVSWTEFDRLCRLLGIQPGDLIEYVEDLPSSGDEHDESSTD